MTAVAQVTESVWAKIGSLVLAPRFVLGVIWTAIVVGMAISATWAVALFWALMALTASATMLGLAGARPLAALSERSHLFLRLSWLVRYGTATAVLCLSTFLGALAGFQAGASDAQTIIGGVGGLLGAVGIWAAKIAAVLFFGWLVVDVYRMSERRRRKGIKRAIRKVVPRELQGVALDGVIVNWFVVLSSRLSTTVSLGAIVVALILALNASGS